MISGTSEAKTWIPIFALRRVSFLLAFTPYLLLYLAVHFGSRSEFKNLWRYEDQNRNAQEIAQRATGIYDKLVGFVDSLEESASISTRPVGNMKLPTEG